MVRLRLLWNVNDSGDAFKVGVAGYDVSVMCLRSRQYDRICHRQLVRETEIGGDKGEFIRQWHYLCLLHRRNGVNGILLRQKPLRVFVHLIDNDCRREYRVELSQPPGIIIGQDAVGKKLKPPG